MPPLPRWERIEVRVTSLIPPHPNLLPPGEKGLLRHPLIPIRWDVAIYVCVALDSRFRGNDGLGIGASQRVYEEWSDKLAA